MQNKRNLNIEALRVYMMLLIVILHISGSYLDADIVRQSSGCEMGWLLGYRSLTFWELALLLLFLDSMA